MKSSKIRSTGVFRGQKGKLNSTKFKRPKVTKYAKADAETGSKRNVFISKGEQAMALNIKRSE